MMLDERGERADFISPNVERVLGVSREAVMEDLARLGRASYTAGGEGDVQHRTAALDFIHIQHIVNQSQQMLAGERTGDERSLSEGNFRPLYPGTGNLPGANSRHR